MCIHNKATHFGVIKKQWGTLEDQVYVREIMLEVEGNEMGYRSSVRELEVPMEVIRRYDDLLSVDIRQKGVMVRGDQKIEKLKDKLRLIKVGEENDGEERGLFEQVENWKFKLLWSRDIKSVKPYY